MSFSGKRFLIVVITVLLASVSAGLPVVAAPADAGTEAVGAVGAVDRSVDFDRGWRFALRNTTGADAPAPSATDPSWRAVDLPHDWSIGLDPSAGPNTLAKSSKRLLA